MQRKTLRTRIATAALLLAPLGALVAAQPAAAQSRFDDHAAYRVARFDRRAPDIFAVNTQQGEHGFTRISARFGDDRSGINPRGVTLRVDGRDVTRFAHVDRNDVSFANDFRPGRHFAELLVRDHAGNLARRTWSFDVGHGGWDHRDFRRG